MGSDLEIHGEWERGRLAVTCRNGELRHADRIDPKSAPARGRFMKGLNTAIPALSEEQIDQVNQALLRYADVGPPTTGGHDDIAESDPGVEGDQALAGMPDDVVSEAKAMLESSSLLEDVLTDIARLGVTGECELALATYVLATSRLLSKPLAGIVQGSSSSGKSHVVETVARLIPDEAKVMATDLTPNALYYMPDGRLRHRFVVAGERSRKEDDDRAEATRALREMISSGILRKLIPQKNGDAMETRVIKSEGPIAFIETTTLPEVFEEDRNRALLLATDDGEQQTRLVVESIAAAYRDPSRTRDVERVVARHHAAQRLLRRCAVGIPFADKIAQCMPVDRPDARRAIHAALGVVQAVALLHQRQRGAPQDHGEVITATIDDYAVARMLVAAPLARALGRGVSDHVAQFADWLRSTYPVGAAFGVPDLQGKDGCRWSEPTCYRHTKALKQAGVLADAGRHGPRSMLKLSGRTLDEASSWLPVPEDL